MLRACSQFAQTAPAALHLGHKATQVAGRLLSAVQQNIAASQVAVHHAHAVQPAHRLCNLPRSLQTGAQAGAAELMGGLLQEPAPVDGILQGSNMLMSSLPGVLERAASGQQPSSKHPTGRLADLQLAALTHELLNVSNPMLCAAPLSIILLGLLLTAAHSSEVTQSRQHGTPSSCAAPSSHHRPRQAQPAASHGQAKPACCSRHT